MQKLIMTNHHPAFAEELRYHLEVERWKVVPGTMIITPIKTRVHGIHFDETAFAVVVETDDEALASLKAPASPGEREDYVPMGYSTREEFEERNAT